MGQQFYVIHNSPQPGTPAHAALEARKAVKKAAKGIPADVVDEVEIDPNQSRKQPKRKPRSKRS